MLTIIMAFIDYINFELLILSFLIGSLGAFSYLVALRLGFIVGNKDKREIILEPFQHESNWVVVGIIVCYSFVGGFISVVFQLPQASFVPIQCFILGVSWPSVVMPYLSGRLSEPTKDEMDDVIKKAKSVGTQGSLSNHEKRRVLKKQRDMLYILKGDKV